MKPKTTALAVGSFVAGIHALWSIIILIGLGQPLLDWIYWLHSLSDPFTVEPFDITRVLFLLIMTFVVGYVGGWCFALLWNKFHAKK